MNASYAASRGVCAELYVAPTTLAEDEGGFGGFVSADLDAFTCIGYFTGKWMRRRSDAPYRGQRASHAMETEDYFVIPHDYSRAYRSPQEQALADLQRYPVAAIQEVPDGKETNCQFVRWYRADDILFYGSRRIRVDAVTLYTTRKVAAGEELFTWYGHDYPCRTWTPGTVSTFSKSMLRPPVLQIPVPPLDAWRPI